ncbi:hypothetical protein RINTHM_1380 [Richelia intracellularis HM01]|nr:hypothetical protein RINTHM_1380 [Richelia intracellularis HM01]
MTNIFDSIDIIKPNTEVISRGSRVNMMACSPVNGLLCSTT